MIMIATDTFSLYTTLTPLRSKESKELIKAVKNLISHFGVMSELHFDEEPGFRSESFNSFAEEYNIKLHYSMPYSAQSNGLIESHVNLAKELIRAYTRQSGQPWTELLLQNHQMLKS